MVSTRKRLAELTADLKLPEDTPLTPQSGAATVAAGTLPPPAATASTLETSFPPARSPLAMPRTGPGQMLAFRGQMREAEGELSALRDRLRRFDGAMPSRRIDPKSVHLSRWANRHEASFRSAAFAGLKKDIEIAGGNIQPILVRPSAEGGAEAYELVFGHRRHRACLELGIPVLACIWEGQLNDSELFAAMDRENREREDLSPYEQGAMYQRALDEQLFPSQRRLAEHLGVSHTWVRKALMVAQLPPAIVECFRSPLEITHRHSEKLTAALEADRRNVLKRADKLRGGDMSASSVVERLLDTGPAIESERVDLQAGATRLGRAARGKGGSIHFELTASGLTGAPRADVVAAISAALDRLSPPPGQPDVQT